MKKRSYLMTAHRIFILLLLPMAIWAKDNPDPKGWTVFEEGRNYGYKDAAGRVQLSARYFSADEFNSCDVAVAGVSGEGWWMIDRKGRKIITPLPYDNGADYLVEGMRRYKNNQEKVGFIDRCARVVVPATYDWASPFTNGYAAVCIGCHFEAVDPYDQDPHPRLLSGKWGYIDKKGRVIVKPQYVWAYEFTQGLAGVCTGVDDWNASYPERQCGFIDTTGKQIIPFRYSQVWPFEDNGTARVRTNGKDTVVDKKGNLISAK